LYQNKRIHTRTKTPIAYSQLGRPEDEGEKQENVVSHHQELIERSWEKTNKMKTRKGAGIHGDQGNGWSRERKSKEEIQD